MKGGGDSNQRHVTQCLVIKRSKILFKSATLHPQVFDMRSGEAEALPLPPPPPPPPLQRTANSLDGELLRPITLLLVAQASLVNQRNSRSLIGLFPSVAKVSRRLQREV